MRYKNTPFMFFTDPPAARDRSPGEGEQGVETSDVAQGPEARNQTQDEGIGVVERESISLFRPAHDIM